MKSKENNVIELFFENPTKEWHFEEIIKTTKIARSKVNKWLNKFIKERLIKKIKEKGKMPYYISDYNSQSYKNKKKLFALNKLYNSGLLNHLTSLNAETIILFGSFSRSDWYKNSDIDIFIYGNHKGLKTAKYEIKLHRSIQLFICNDKKDLKKLGVPLIRNIIKGNILKGDINFLKVDINA